jgi:hypothetical protein
VGAQPPDFALPGSPHQPGPRWRPGLRSRMIWVTTTWVAVPKENNYLWTQIVRD